MRIRHAMRHHADLSVLIIDIDRFRKVSDRHGQAAGDERLRRLSPHPAPPVIVSSKTRKLPH
ncbi:diguanylate cyclase domain-containing protein [Xanthobacter agilis]|uniref:diguanylate cyclase domain-containing protein n=2 Tax=Xanthobacter agilis TaxID=47492 RepID=UPI0035212B01